MKKTKSFAMLALAAALAVPTMAQRQLTVQANKPGAVIQPTMYGIFFEDINFGADGGLYAEMVQNRSFEFPNRLMGWEVFGNVALRDERPAFANNPHYVAITDPGHAHKRSGIENRGFFGMGFKKDLRYDFSVYARLHDAGSQTASIRVELVNSHNNVIKSEKVSINSREWKKYTCSITPNITDPKGLMRIFLEGSVGVDLDHVSLFPSDNWNGLRADLVKDLEDLHPGVFRFPGGCIVEGTDLASRYQWKNSVGQVENRPLNENRWNYTFPHRMYPNYFQTYGMGFYEFFLLSEKIGADPLPVVSCGLACQYQNDDIKAHVALDQLQPYIDDALDLIEFANGGTDTKWGKLRADMGHPAPFNLKQIGVGNEQWGELYPERLELFVKAIRAKYPNILICGSSGPLAEGNDFDYGWKEMKRLKVDLVDEHYYKPPQWFFDNAGRYDNYDRKGPKVFAGEYAAHGKGAREVNNWEAALSEAAFMTGLERNADVVYQATYAPLFAHVEGWQWKPDLIWFDNLTSARTPNWYVQMLYGTNKGTNVLKLTEDKQPVEGKDGLYASAVYDKDKKEYIVKLANSAEKSQKVVVTFKGLKNVGAAKGTLLTGNYDMENLVGRQETIKPTTVNLQGSGNTLTIDIPSKAFMVVKF
ncbi:MAG: carbohydrate binding domain-containing protein [Prevotella sp.]|nr:carbohydrate binding domain-containing protein [Prevotella sp.]